MKTKLSVLIAVVVVAAFAAWWQFGMNHGMDHSGHGKSKTEEPSKVSKYICPMHPHISSDKPGTCSICGMDLVPADESDEHEDHDHDEHSKATSEDEWESVTEKEDHSGHQMQTATVDGHIKIKLTLKKQQLIGVKLGKAEKKNLFKTISAPGRIAFDPELYTAQSEYLEALRQWSRVKNSPIDDVKENTKQMINSSKIRLKILGLSSGQISALAKKGSQSEGLLVTGKGQENWIYADVFEVDLPFIKKGNSAQISANFLQGKILPGKVISVDQVINPETRTAKVRIQLLKTDQTIRPESYVNVSILTPVGKHTAVPLEAVMDTGKQSFVFVKKDKGQFEPRLVVILLETENHAAIASGVLPGEEIVVSGNFMLDSESRLKAVIQGSSAPSGHNH